MTEWQDIKTAPRDKSEFLGYWPDFYGNDSWNITRTWYDPELEEWHTPENETDFDSPDAPTHWMSLPDSPESPQ